MASNANLYCRGIYYMTIFSIVIFRNLMCNENASFHDASEDRMHIRDCVKKDKKYHFLLTVFMYLFIFCLLAGTEEFKHRARNKIVGC